jgi:hypothetical protein
MAVYGCSGDHGASIVIMREDIPEDGGMFVKFYAGCPTCGGNYCRTCFEKQGGACSNGHPLTVGVTGERTGDWRLPKRLRVLVGEEARLAELEVMRAELKGLWEQGMVTRLDLEHNHQYEEEVIRGLDVSRWIRLW